MNVLRVFFHWPDGGVWSNLLASLIWALPTVGVAVVKVRKHLKRLHASHAELHAKLDALHRHHGITTDREPRV